MLATSSILSQLVYCGSNGLAMTPPMTWRSWNQPVPCLTPRVTALTDNLAGKLKPSFCPAQVRVVH